MVELLWPWPELGFEHTPHIVERFTEGENHSAIQVRYQSQDLVVKRFNHSFDHALHAQHYAATLGLAPQVRCSAPPFMVMEYLAANTSRAVTMALADIAVSLGRLHQATDTFDVFCIHQFCQDNLALCDPSARQWHDALTPALQDFAQNTSNKTFCHNDLVLENIIIGTDRVQFIDWEYAMQNNPWFDLAAVIVYAGLDRQQSQDFLSQYDPVFAQQIESPIFISSQIALLWLDLLWHWARDAAYPNRYPQRFAHLKRLANQFGLSLAS